MWRWVLVALLWACDDGGGGGNPPPKADAGLLDEGVAPDVEVQDAEVDAELDALPDSFVIVDAEPPPLGEPDEVWRVYAGFNDIPPVMSGYNEDENNERQPFRWTLPPTDWTLSVTVLHGPEWSPSEPPYLLLRGPATRVAAWCLGD